jgi:hypothetical protein
MRRALTIAGLTITVALALAAPAWADQNPAGHGQPGTANPNGVACGNPGATSQPNGFGTAGFANAASHYAGSPNTGSLHSGNSHAVAEYDIACYQVTQNHWQLGCRPVTGGRSGSRGMAPLVNGDRRAGPSLTVPAHDRR